MAEVELKFELTRESLEGLERSAWFRAWHRPLTSEKLVSVYFDTPEHSIHRQRGSLRVRYVDGRRLQTIKAAGSGLAREEHEEEIGGDYPKLSRGQARLFGGNSKKLERRLRPRFETAVERESMRVEAPHGVVQIAIDRGEIRAEGQTQPLHEIELELEQGSPEGLAEVGAGLVDELDVRYEARSKAERGYALEHGAVEPAWAEPLELKTDASVAAAFRSTGFAALRHFSLNRAGVVARLPEASHQMRVGLRRLRAVMSVFKELLQDPESARLKAELRWLTNELGDARDFEVFARQNAELGAERERYAPEMAALCAALEQRRAEGLARAARAVESERYRRLLNALALWLAGGAWATTTDELVRTRRERRARAFARAELRARTRKLHARLKKIATLDDQARHELRISVKKLRYAAEFFGSLFPRRKRRRATMLALLKELQEALGRLNDGVIHERVAKHLVLGERLPSGEVPDRTLAFAVGLVCGREDAAVDAVYARLGRARGRLTRRTHFWR